MNEEGAARGRITMIDYSFQNPKLSNPMLSTEIFHIMHKNILSSPLKIVDSGMILLPAPQNPLSEEGCTSFIAMDTSHKYYNNKYMNGSVAYLSLDSSHLSMHLYYSKFGLNQVAIDLFSCGSADCEKIIGNINSDMKKLIPDIIITFTKSFDRFAGGASCT